MAFGLQNEHFKKLAKTTKKRKREHKNSTDLFSRFFISQNYFLLPATFFQAKKKP
jgi:hypothetical protein